MRHIVKVFFLLFAVFVSCADDNIETISFNDFGVPVQLTRTNKAIGGFIVIDDYFVTDSLLVIENLRNDSVFMVYDLNDLKLSYSWGTQGRAGNEYIIPRPIKNGDNMIITDFNSQKIEWWNLSQQLLTGSGIMRIEDVPQSIVSIDDSTFVYDRVRPKEMDLLIWKLGQKPVEIFDFEYLAQKYLSTNIYLGFLGANKKEAKIIYAYQYINGFDIFDMNGNILKKVRRESRQEPVIKNNSIDYLESKTYCFGLRARNDSFFLYYVGYSGGELMSDINRITYIEEYDWNGNPLRIYSLPSFVSNFDVLSDDAMICQDNYSDNEPLVVFER